VKKIGFLSLATGRSLGIPRPYRGRCPLVIHRPRDGDRTTGRRRRILSCPSFRMTIGLTVPAPGGHRREHKPHRDRHRGHRHALREPALHGRGSQHGSTHARGASALRCRSYEARHPQRRCAGAGDRTGEGAGRHQRVESAGRGPGGQRKGSRRRLVIPRTSARRGARSKRAAFSWSMANHLRTWRRGVCDIFLAQPVQGCTACRVGWRRPGYGHDRKIDGSRLKSQLHLGLVTQVLTFAPIMEHSAVANEQRGFGPKRERSRCFLRCLD
jgi:hypothetical protein